MQNDAFWAALDEAKRRPGEIGRETVLALLEGSARAHEKEALFRAADEVRRRYVGDEVYLRGIIEFSNHCVRNCHYCGLRAANVGPTDYRPLYQIYPGKICVGEGAEKCKSCLGRMIVSLGRTVGQGPGHSPKPRFGQSVAES